jgi:hypothetical protein
MNPNTVSVIDAFTVDGSMLYQSPDPRPFAVHRLDVLREAQAFVPRQYVTPQVNQTPISNGDAAYFQVRVPLGTILWGILFYDGGASADEVFQIYETRGRKLLSEPCNPIQTIGNSSAGPRVTLLVEPFVVASTGELNVEIYKGQSTDLSSVTFPAQLVLLCGEPTDRSDQCPNP